ncbi:hypothetical protein C8024_17260 [Sphingopyxis sp. BSNA05]|nr:hypothetical protein [Sphingopyxis sp. BSNA05]
MDELAGKAYPIGRAFLLLVRLAAHGQDEDAAFGNQCSEWCIRQDVGMQVDDEASDAIAAGARLGMADRLAVNADNKNALAVRRKGQARLSG